MGIGRNIKRLAKEKGLTLVELSTKSGVSLNTIYMLTREDPENATVRTLSRLARALDVNVNKLSLSSEEYEGLSYRSPIKDLVSPRGSF